MKKFILALALALLVSVSVQAQDPQARRVFQTIVPAADFGIFEIGNGVQYHQLVWNVTGTVTTCQVTLQSSADNITWGGTVIAAQTCTSNGASALSVLTVANYVRINVTTKSGAGTVTVTYLGYTSAPSGGGGSVVSCTTTGGVAFENGTNNTLTCSPDLFWDNPDSFLGATCTPAQAFNTAGCIEGALQGVVTPATDANMSSVNGNTVIIANAPDVLAADYIGMYGGATVQGNGTFTGHVNGVEAKAVNNGTGSAPLNGVYAQGNVNNGGGTVPLSTGINCGPQNGVSATRNACFYAPNQGSGANDYAYYSVGGKNFFGGPQGSQFGGPVSVTADGVHAGLMSVIGNTTAPAIAANSFGFAGPNSAAFTSYFFQPSATAPTTGQCLVVGTVVLPVVPLNYNTCGTGTVTSIATTGPITGGTITTTGTIACPTCVTSAAALTLNGVVIGQGLQATTTIAVDATTTHALFATAGAPVFRAIVAGDLPASTGAIVNVPATTAANTIAPTTNGVVGLTVVDTTGTGTPDIADFCTVVACNTTKLTIGSDSTLTNIASISAGGNIFIDNQGNGNRQLVFSALGDRIGTASNANGDVSGTLVVTASTTSPTFTFPTAYTNVPSCVISPRTDPTVVGVFWPTVTNTTILANVKVSGTITFNYICVGLGN